MTWAHLPNSLFSAESGGGFLGRSGFSDGARSVMSSGMSMRSRSSRRGSKKGTSTMRRSGITSSPLTGDHGADLWISSLRDFRANHSAVRESSWRKMIRAMGSPPPSASYAKYDQESHGWKTFQVSFMDGTVTLAPFLGSFTKQGTMRSGVCFRQKKSVRHTRGRDSGSLPTPKVSRSTYDRNPRTGEKVYTLAGMARHGKLQDYSIPTPTVDDADNSSLPPSQITRGNLPGHLLREGVASGGQLNPEWVEWLMGWVIGWTGLEALAMDRFQLWLRKHGVSYGEE